MNNSLNSNSYRESPMEVVNEESPLAVSDDHNLLDSLSSMSAVEMSQHLEMCIKLASENKINSKNCFNLHLISMLKKVVSQSSDLQLAALGLQASSKIYAGRVEALYKDTFSFHSHLQSIINQSSKKDGNADMDTGECEDNNRKSKSARKSKFKSFLTSEDNVSLTNLNFHTNKPHWNFAEINSAFATAVTGLKLLHIISNKNDSCIIPCGTPNLCFKNDDLQSCNLESKNIASLYLNKLKEKIVHMAKKRTSTSFLNPNFDDFCDPPPDNFGNNNSPGAYIAPPDNFDNGCNKSMTSDVCLSSPLHSEQVPIANGANFDALIDKFSALDITAAEFSKEVAHVLSSKGDLSVNCHNLPPASALKKLLKDTCKPKVLKERKPNEPKTLFFKDKGSVLKRFFSKKEKHGASYMNWTLFECSELNIMSNKDFFPGNSLQEESDNVELLEKEFQLQKKAAEKCQHNNVLLKNKSFMKYFWKKEKLHKFAQRQANKVIIRPSLFGLPRTDMAETNDEDLAPQLQHLSIFEGVHEDMIDEHDSTFNENNLHPLPENNFLNDNFSMFDNFSDLLVPLPDMVKPFHVAYQKQPVALNIEKIKSEMWKIICNLKDTDPSISFTQVYTQLKQQSKSEEPISLQFAFVVLLILANEKVLLLENVAETADIVIQKDTNELEQDQRSF